jgi:hypothetical protein
MAEIQFSKTLGTPYVHLSDGWVTRTGVFLPDAEADAAMKEGKLSSLYAKMERRKDRYDWKSAVEGSLIPAEEKAENSFSILQALLTVTAAGAMAVSFLLSRSVQMLNAGAFTGTLLSVIMVLFESGAFPAAMEFKRRKQYAFCALFLLVFSLVEVYSMSNTVQVFFASYEQRSGQSVEGHSEVNGARLALSSIEDAIESKKDMIKSLKANIAYYSESGWGVRNFTDSLEKAGTELSALQEKKTRILEETPEAVVTEDTKEVTFFGELSSVTGKSERGIALLFALFPALFVDLIAPFALAAGVGLKQKEIN